MQRHLVLVLVLLAAASLVGVVGYLVRVRAPGIPPAAPRPGDLTVSWTTQQPPIPAPPAGTRAALAALGADVMPLAAVRTAVHAATAGTPAAASQAGVWDVAHGLPLDVVRFMAKQAFAALGTGAWEPLRSTVSARAQEDFRSCAEDLGRVTGVVEDRAVLLALDAADAKGALARVLLEARLQLTDANGPRQCVVRQEWTLRRESETKWVALRVQAIPPPLDAS